MKVHFMLFALAFSQCAKGQTIDTIRGGDRKLRLQNLPTGTQRYLVYIKNTEGKHRNIWLWERTTTRESWRDTAAIVIRQHWVTSDTGLSSRDVFSVNDPTTFLPIYHYTRNPKTGEDSFHVFASLDNSHNNANERTGTFNWELDLETFPLLPLQEGKTFAINFWHPGSKTGPSWYIYRVTGSDKLRTAGGREIDCYTLYTEYENNRGNSTWWISKDSHEILKMEEHFGSMTRFKIKLSVTE